MIFSPYSDFLLCALLAVAIPDEACDVCVIVAPGFVGTGNTILPDYIPYTLGYDDIDI